MVRGRHPGTPKPTKFATKAGRIIMRGPSGKAFVFKMVKGKAVKVYNPKAVRRVGPNNSRPLISLNQRENIPANIRPKAKGMRMSMRPAPNNTGLMTKAGNVIYKDKKSGRFFVVKQRGGKNVRVYKPKAHKKVNSSGKVRVLSENSRRKVPVTLRRKRLTPTKSSKAGAYARRKAGF